MEIGAIYIPTDGNIFIKKQSEKDIFNDIGYFITAGKSDKLDVKMCYQTTDITYELIIAADNNDILNLYASRLMSSDVHGNVVLIASTEKLVSIDNYGVIEQIHNQTETLKFVTIDEKHKFNQFTYSTTELNKVINKILCAETGVKKIQIQHFEIYGVI